MSSRAAQWAWSAQFLQPLNLNEEISDFSANISATNKDRSKAFNVPASLSPYLRPTTERMTPWPNEYSPCVLGAHSLDILTLLATATQLKWQKMDGWNISVVRSLHSLSAKQTFEMHLSDPADLKSTVGSQSDSVSVGWHLTITMFLSQYEKVTSKFNYSAVIC